MRLHGSWRTRFVRVGLLLLAFRFGHTAAAQGLRVSTQIYDVSAEAQTGRPTAVSGSLSLFRHGKVYDYVDAADEVVILDPAERRFIVLNTARQLSTTLSFDEMQHLFKSREPVTRQIIAELFSRNEPQASRTAGMLEFQLKPEFQRTISDNGSRLTLAAPSWTYQVQTTEWKNPDTVEQYLGYADWMARLNHLLHPGALFPEPRLELNAALRDLKRLPVTVELDLRPGESLRLRAEHSFTDGLQEDDHRRIARWDGALTDKSVRAVSFRSYQQTVLVTSSRK